MKMDCVPECHPYLTLGCQIHSNTASNVPELTLALRKSWG